MSAISKINAVYPTLSAAEKRIADYILENTELVPRMVLNAIAREASVSVPSVTRLVKKLGYDGFLDFRVDLVSELRDSRSVSFVEHDAAGDEPVSSLFMSSIRALEETLSGISTKDLTEVTNAIRIARRVIVFGIETSAAKAERFCKCLCSFGLDAVFISDYESFQMVSKNFSENDMFIGITCAAPTVGGKNTIDAMKLAVAIGMYTLLISNYMSSPALSSANVFICAAKADALNRKFCFDADVGMNAVLNFISLTAAANSTTADADT